MKLKKEFDFNVLHNKVYSNLLQSTSNDLYYGNILSQYKEESDNVEDLLKRALTLGESNSLLLIGPRGCGKTLLIETVLTKLKTEKILQYGLVVKLTGLLQTDDRLALREITRQLNVEGETAYKFGSFAENLNFILKTLQKGSKESSKPIIFILDEFDLFCHHRNQTLLYNLFDISQSSQAPICVVGLTCRLDVIELLEKRVKSRFSHRQIYMFPQEKFGEYVEEAKNLLKVNAINDKELMKMWNDKIEEIFKNSELNGILQERFCISRDMRSLKMLLLYAITELNLESPWLSIKNFEYARSKCSEDSKTKVMESISILQLSLLIAMKHLNEIYDGEPFNFEMVFKQYKKLGEKHSSMSSYERPVVFKAFDELEGLELIRPVDQARSTLQREYRMMQLLATPQQIDAVIQNMQNLPTFMKYWCESNVL